MAKEEKHEEDYEGNADLLFPSDYIRAADLMGNDVTLTITSVEKNAELSMAGGIKKKKPIVHFKETEKMLVLNKTNKDAIISHYGNVVAEWKGKKVTVYATTCSMKGETVDCARVREKETKNGK